MVGEGAATLVARAFRAAGVEPPRDALERYLACYDARLLNHTRPYDGIPEALEALGGRAALAVLTNKPIAATRRILAGLDLARHFPAAAVLGGDGPFARKPDPAGLLALQELAPGDQLVMIGDSPADWQAATAANVPFVFTRYGFGAVKFGVTLPETPLVIDHARQLDRALAEITRS